MTSHYPVTRATSAAREVLFIAYCVHTGPQLVATPTGYKQHYLGIPDVKEDINARIKLVSEVITQAQKTVERNYPEQNDATKIFMMPEFFFRGPQGAYTLEQVKYIINNLQELVRESGRWKNWIFIFGTILGFSSNESWIVNKEVENFALIQEGGFGFHSMPDAYKYSTLIYKESLSGIDFIKNSKKSKDGVIILERVNHPLTVNQHKLYELLKIFQERWNKIGYLMISEDIQLNKNHLGNLLEDPSKVIAVIKMIRKKPNSEFCRAFKTFCEHYKNDPILAKFLYDKSSKKLLSVEKILSDISRSEEFDINGSILTVGRGQIKLGLEVCLDHGVKRLKNSKNLPSNIDIQLIPSCGMTIGDDAIVARLGGYVFNCDGLNKGTPHSMPFHQTDATTGQTYYSHAEVRQAGGDLIKPDSGKPVDVPDDLPVNRLYPGGAGALVFYPPLSLPTLTTSFSKSIFSEPRFTAATSEEPVSINGMKVIFDHAVPVCPVVLHPKKNTNKEL